MRRAWIAVWDRHEPADSLALVRIFVGLVIAFDFARILQLDLAVPLFGGVEVGGFSQSTDRWIYALLPATAAGAIAVAVTVMGVALLFAAGVATPVMTVLLLLLYAQAEALSPLTDRGVDRLLRHALVILAFSRCGRAWSVDARLRSGRWRGDGALVPAWPRHLLVLQLIAVYFSSGVAKVGAAWTFAGDYSALYRVLSDPGMASFPIPALDTLYPLTQAASLATVVWEWSAPIVLLGFWYRHTAHRGGRLRRLFARWHPDRWWLLIGVFFHLGIAVFLSLGIFSWGLLALYPAFFHPREIFWGRRSDQSANT